MIIRLQFLKIIFAISMLLQKWTERSTVFVFQAATNFINKNSVTLKAEKHAASKSSELLARHCDGLLRKSAKLPEEEELEKMLDDVVRLI